MIVQLRDSINSQKKTRKCYCCMMIVLIIIILATVSGVGAVFGVKNA